MSVVTALGVAMQSIKPFDVPLCAVYQLSRPDQSEPAEETAAQAEDSTNDDGEVAEEKHQ